MKLNEKIIALRKDQGWSQEELAERMGVSRQSVSKWESGASTPELDRIVQLCALFNLTADQLIREDMDLPGMESAPEPDGGLPRVTLQDAYAYLAQHQTVARKIALGAAACVLAPGPLVAVSGVGSIGLHEDLFCMAIGLPLLFLMVAWGVWLFISAGSIAEPFRHIEKRLFHPGPGVTEWARSAQAQFLPSLRRDVALGVVLCVLSPAPMMPLLPLSQLIFGSEDLGPCVGSAFLLAMVAAGVYLIVRSCTLQNCYRRLLREKDV